jgi:aspartyl-tRNA(Asn)/glutamyl-tRNA(Gln) amidotransferase subunit A
MRGGARYRDIGVDEYRAATGIELGRLVAEGVLSPVALAELALGLAADAEPALNAYVFFRRGAALREAAALEAEVRGGRLRSALHGVPIAVKDNMYLAGEPTYKGSLTTTDEPAASSAPMVERLVRAGAVAIGKTTTPEFGWKGTGISPRTGVTRNPWNPGRNSGGSSAGSGATVGSGAVPVALGSDAGGSIRIPASFCGVVGFKPTLGAIPVWPGTVNETLSHAGPLTRSVADARAVFELTRGFDPRDPQSAYPGSANTGSANTGSASTGSSATARHLAAADPDGGESGLRVGIVTAPFGISPESGVTEVFAVAQERLRAAGLARFVDVSLDLPVPRSVFEAMWVTGRGLGFAELIRTRGDVMDPGLARLLGLAEQYSLTQYYAAVEARRAFSAAVFALFTEVDLLLMPTMPLTAFAADAEVPAGGEADAKLPWITWTPYTYPFNITGQPAISIPGGRAADGLPVGVQVVGRWGDDERVLAFAEECERALGLAAAERVAPLRVNRAAPADHVAREN